MEILRLNTFWSILTVTRSCWSFYSFLLFTYLLFTCGRSNETLFYACSKSAAAAAEARWTPWKLSTVASLAAEVDKGCRGLVRGEGGGGGMNSTGARLMVGWRKKDSVPVVHWQVIWHEWIWAINLPLVPLTLSYPAGAAWGRQAPRCPDLNRSPGTPPAVCRTLLLCLMDETLPSPHTRPA